MGRPVFTKTFKGKDVRENDYVEFTTQVSSPKPFTISFKSYGIPLGFETPSYNTSETSATISNRFVVPPGTSGTDLIARVYAENIDGKSFYDYKFPVVGINHKPSLKVELNQDGNVTGPFESGGLKVKAIITDEPGDMSTYKVRYKASFTEAYVSDGPFIWWGAEGLDPTLSIPQIKKDTNARLQFELTDGSHSVQLTKLIELVKDDSEVPQPSPPSPDPVPSDLITVYCSDGEVALISLMLQLGIDKGHIMISTIGGVRYVSEDSVAKTMSLYGTGGKVLRVEEPDQPPSPSPAGPKKYYSSFICNLEKVGDSGVGITIGNTPTDVTLTFYKGDGTVEPLKVIELKDQKLVYWQRMLRDYEIEPRICIATASHPIGITSIFVTDPNNPEEYYAFPFIEL
jgi:hypothetical protein